MESKGGTSWEPRAKPAGAAPVRNLNQKDVKLPRRDEVAPSAAGYRAVVDLPMLAAIEHGLGCATAIG